ncbi:cupin domain-containing protein [Chloroflexota bacterium]
MEFSELITRLPQADLPYDGVVGYLLRSDDGLLVFLHFVEESIVPPHAHGAQWGTVLAGSIELTIGGVTKTYRPGESYSIASGEVHSAIIPADTKVQDFFEEPDRFQPKAS